MNTNENENGNSQNTDTEEEIIIADDATQEEKDEASKKLIESNKRLYARAKKAEGFVQDKDGKWTKSVKTETPPEKKEENQNGTVQNSNTLSTTDLYAIMNAKVPEEDVDDVQEYARFKKISVKEALGSDFVKQLLSDKAEKRTTANAAHTGNARRTTGKSSDESLLAKAQEGELPESEEDMMRLIKARKGIK